MQYVMCYIANTLHSNCNAKITNSALIQVRIYFFFLKLWLTNVNFFENVIYFIRSTKHLICEEVNLLVKLTSGFTYLHRIYHLRIIIQLFFLIHCF